MMKKSLCVVFVLALIAQICARPADEKVDPEEKVEDQVVTASKDAKDKVEDVADKAANVAKGVVDHKKQAAADAVKHGKEVADSFKKHGEDCHKPSAEGHHGGIISDFIRKQEKIGKELVKRGEDVFENIFGKLGL